jgi:hypothetical protein
MSGRNERLLAGLRREDPIIEVGPLHGPIAPKAAGWNTTVVDHAPRADLLRKYDGHPGVDAVQIEEVDIVWQGGPLHEAFPAERHGTYRMLLASHVLEHIPDAVGFLDSAARLLHPKEGVLALALPDKRWCFDVLKPVSTTGQMLAAHRAGLRRHTPGVLFDHNAYSASDKDRPGWGREAVADLRFYVSLEAAKQAFDAWSAEPDTPYVDCHAWQFTPASFELLILELGAVDVLDWRVEWIETQPTVEFTTHLHRGRERFASVELREARRMSLLRQVAAELREQADWLLGGPATMPQPIAERIDARLARMEEQLAQLEKGHPPEEAANLIVSPMQRALAQLWGRK